MEFSEYLDFSRLIETAQETEWGCVFERELYPKRSRYCALVPWEARGQGVFGKGAVPFPDCLAGTQISKVPAQTLESYQRLITKASRRTFSRAEGDFPVDLRVCTKTSQFYESGDGQFRLLYLDLEEVENELDMQIFGLVQVPTSRFLFLGGSTNGAPFVSVREFSFTTALRQDLWIKDSVPGKMTACTLLVLMSRYWVEFTNNLFCGKE